MDPVGTELEVAHAPHSLTARPAVKTLAVHGADLQELQDALKLAAILPASLLTLVNCTAMLQPLIVPLVSLNQDALGAVIKRSVLMPPILLA